MKPSKGFDRLASIYDLLVKLVFRNSIRLAQQAVIEQAREGHWLIIGGGTGWVLEEVFQYHPKARVTYLDASSKMINKAKARKLNGEVIFMQGTIDDLKPENRFDVIMTPFFWDMFNTATAITLKRKLDQCAKNDAQWLLVDFQNTDIWWQKLLMRIMYWFFRLTCGIEVRELPAFDRVYDSKFHEEQFQQEHYHGMIMSKIYRSK